MVCPAMLGRLICLLAAVAVFATSDTTFAQDAKKCRLQKVVEWKVRSIGRHMTQRFSFWEDLTIRENLEFTARVYAMEGRKAAVDRAVDELGLGGRQHQLTGTLSGGWKQRLALAACMPGFSRPGGP